MTIKRTQMIPPWIAITEQDYFDITTFVKAQGYGLTIDIV